MTFCTLWLTRRANSKVLGEPRHHLGSRGARLHRLLGKVSRPRPAGPERLADPCIGRSQDLPILRQLLDPTVICIRFPPYLVYTPGMLALCMIAGVGSANRAEILPRLNSGMLTSRRVEGRSREKKAQLTGNQHFFVQGLHVTQSGSCIDRRRPISALPFQPPRTSPFHRTLAIR